MRRRVVVTGMGVVSCFGTSIDAFYEALLAGRSGVQTITHFPTDDLPCNFGAPIVDFDPEPYLDKKQARRVDPAIAFATVAGKKGIESARLDLSEIDKKRAGVVIGSGMGGMSVFVDGVRAAYEKGVRRVSPFFIPYSITNMPGATLAMDLGFMGPNYSISTACATANYSIIAAAEHIRKGDTDLMVAGGAEACVIPIGMAGFSACKALSTRNEAPERASRPWDKGRDGFVMGEGAGVLILESLEHATKRGATILAEYLGGGISCDAYHMTEPHPDGVGVVLCLERALADAQITAERVNYINAHATSTPLGDMAEVKALHEVFLRPEKIVMNGTKSMTGHALGGAGGLEAIVCVEAIRRSEIHPTINLEEPEEGLGFEIPTKAIKREIEIAISNSFGFGGHNATLVFGKYGA